MIIIKNIFKIYNQLKTDILKNKHYKKTDIMACLNILRDKQKFLNRNFLKNKNKKLSINVFSFDIPVGITCNSICKNCYAIKNERMMPTVRISRLLNYIVILYALLDNNFNKFFIKKIQSELNNIKLIYKNPIIRLHTSGDMFNSDCLNLWLKIIDKNKKIKFYTYTKMAWLLPQVDNINNKYKNFNIIKSIINIDNNNYINYGDSNYIDEIVNKCKENGMDYYICDYNKNNIRHEHTCMVQCKACLNCSNILFYKH